MAKRFVDTNIWNREWFMMLPCKHKCLIRYLFDNCDHAGVWKPNWSLATLHIGESVTIDDMKHLPKEQYELLPNGKIFLPDFINFQYTTLSEKSPAHKPVFESLSKNNLLDRVFNRVSNTLQVKAIAKDTDINTESIGSERVVEAARLAWEDQGWREQTCMAHYLKNEEELKRWMAQYNASVMNDFIPAFDFKKYKKMFGGWMNKQREKGYKLPDKPTNGASQLKTLIPK